MHALGVHNGNSVLLSATTPLESVKDIKDREIFLLIAASWIGHPENFWKKFSSNELRYKISRKAIEILDVDQELDAYSAAMAAGKIFRADLSLTDAWLFLFKKFIYILERWTELN